MKLALTVTLFFVPLSVTVPADFNFTPEHLSDKNTGKLDILVFKSLSLFGMPSFLQKII